MKRILCSLIGLPLLVAATPVQAQLAQWTFEVSAPATPGPFAPEVGSGGGLGSHSGAAVYSSPAGNGSAHSFSATRWAVGDYWQFQTSTVGYSGIGLSWDQTSSDTGPRDFDLLYSTDGSSFTAFASYVVQKNSAPNPAWNMTTASAIYSYSYDLSSVVALDNAPAVYFRLVDTSTTSASGGTVSTVGTDRVDNFTIAVIPEPGCALLGGFGLLIWSLLRRRQ